jgi:hypothetical protein
VWFGGFHRVIAWPLLIAGQAVFLAYSSMTEQLGFWPLNMGMIIIGARNWWLWSHETRDGAPSEAQDAL